MAKRTKRRAEAGRSGNQSGSRPSGKPVRSEPPASPSPQAAPPALPAGILSAVVVGVATPVILSMVQPQTSTTASALSPTGGADPLLFVAQAGPTIGDSSVSSYWITKSVAAGEQKPTPADGVLASGGWVELTMQAASGETVILENISVQLVSRQPPAAGDLLEPDEGGGELDPRYFALDLDAPTPALVAYPGDNAGQNIPAARFPFTVSEQDPEVFLIQVNASLSMSSFRLELHWVSNGRAGTTTVDNQGQPFVVSSISRATVYCPDPASGAWRPSSAQSCA
jgi:hypothetical protein